jgi:hypothetical protein
MPGPRNIKKKRKSGTKREKNARGKESSSLDNHQPSADLKPLSPSLSPLPPRLPLQPYNARQFSECLELVERKTAPLDEILLKTPYIHDPGNGPRVRDTRTFLASYFAQPPTLEDPMCAEFAQEVIDAFLIRIMSDLVLGGAANVVHSTSRGDCIGKLGISKMYGILIISVLDPVVQ